MARPDREILKAGNLTDAGFDSLLNLTKGLSESQAKLLTSSTALSEAQRVLLLMNTGMSEAEAQAAVAAMGLSAANGTAAASTVTLSGALSGLWATLMANPLILVAAGVTAAVAAISSYNNSVKEAVSSARESGNAWEENNTSIEDNISRIQELRTELESGTLTEQEAADAKSELLSIQESLTDSYGNQVEGIDLINGSLQQQIDLLDKVSQKQSENFLNENKKGIDKATKEMEKNRHTYAGRFYDDGSDEAEAIKTSIKKLQDTYGDEVVKLDKSSDGITTDIHINADATQAKEVLNDFMTEISGVEDTYGESLQGLTPEVMVKAGIDSSLVDAYKPDDKDATVKYGTDTSKPDSYKPDDKNATVTYGVDHSLVDAYNPSNLSREVVYTIKTNGTPPSGAKSSGANSVNGTANVNGTAHYNHITGRAYADGNWSTKTGGTTLVGELGREIVVDPSTGKWHTVGDNGAEFTNIPAGAIVFNHKQSEALLERGFVAGRGKAMAGGSAMVTGGISVKQANIASGKTTYSGSKSSGNSANASNTNATKANTNATKANTKSTKKSTSAFDFVARALSAFANRTKAIADTINDYVTSAFKTSQLSKQMSAINAEIKANTKGAAAYLAKANSVGLNRTQRDAVINGRYRITDYNTESKNDGSKTEYDKLQEYAKYYDEYVKCTQAVQDLKNQQLELFEQWANMPTEAAEKKIEKLKAGFNGLTAIQARLKTASLGGSAQAYLNNELKSSVNSTKKTRDNAKGNLNNANKRLSSANKSYSTARRTESVL